MPAPLISIVTPSFNRSAMIRDAIESVLSQGRIPYEHIIVDGGSTDGTLEILGSYRHLQVISEPDKGLYDALNKGIRLARGEIIAWLNSDDMFGADTFESVADAFASTPVVDAVMGTAITFDDTDPSRSPLRFDPPITESTIWKRLADGPTDPNAWFIKRNAFDRYGFYNASLLLVADRDFLFRAALIGLRPLPLERIVYLYRQHPGSLTFSAVDSRNSSQGLHRMVVLGEDISMLQALLTIPTLPENAKNAILAAHSDRTYRLAATALYHRRIRLCMESAIRGCQADPRWPIIAASMGWRRIARGFIRR